jgi:hypothetical protein
LATWRLGLDTRQAMAYLTQKKRLLWQAFIINTCRH